MKAIQKELGEGDDQAKEIDELREKIDAAGMPDEVKKEALRELDRLSKMPAAAAEYTVARTYIDWLVALPWSEAHRRGHRPRRSTKAGARRRSLRPRARQGPHPRVPRGAQAEAGREGPDPLLRRALPASARRRSPSRSRTSLGRKFVRVSLGGMRDEAEIRGHRRTYIGALPGQIIQGLRRAESQQPGVHPRRDRQARHRLPRRSRRRRCSRCSIRSRTTRSAITTSTCRSICRRCCSSRPRTCSTRFPAPLRDRMEVLELAGLHRGREAARSPAIISSRKQIANHGLSADEVTFEDDALRAIIRGYTREAGVRNLEREIGSICRKIARRRAEGDVAPVIVTPRRSSRSCSARRGTSTRR